MRGVHCSWLDGSQCGSVWGSVFCGDVEAGMHDDDFFRVECFFVFGPRRASRSKCVVALVSVTSSVLFVKYAALSSNVARDAFSRDATGRS
eukprot:5317990-Pyramimonas_sp.AAC.1